MAANTRPHRGERRDRVDVTRHPGPVLRHVDSHEVATLNDFIGT